MTKATHFAAEWLRNPKRVGAIAPSGADLAKAITTGLNHDSGPIVELGPGTGSFTDRILARGVPACRLAAVEAGAVLPACWRSGTRRSRLPMAMRRGYARLCPFPPEPLRP